MKYELQYTTSLYKVTCFSDTFLPQYQDVNRSFHFLVVLIMSHLLPCRTNCFVLRVLELKKKRESNLHKLYVYMHRRQHKVLLVNSNVMSTLNHWSACITFITVRKKKFRFKGSDNFFFWFFSSSWLISPRSRLRFGTNKLNCSLQNTRVVI